MTGRYMSVCSVCAYMCVYMNMCMCVCVTLIFVSSGIKGYSSYLKLNEETIFGLKIATYIYYIIAIIISCSLNKIIHWN